MSTNTKAVSIDSKSEFIEQVRTTGVLHPEAGLVHTEGEGRQTRYFVGDERVGKGDVESLFEAGSDWEVPVDADFEYGGIRCRTCGKVVGYLTGSHMGTHEDIENAPTTVAEYREMVAEADGIDPEDVPLSTDEMMDAIAERNRARWEAGEYDHLRKEA